MVMVHLCRDAAFSGRLSHDTFFYGVGLAVLSDELFVKWSGKMVIELKYSGTNAYFVRGTN